MVWLHFFPGRPWRRGGKGVRFFILFRICIFPVLFMASCGFLSSASICCHGGGGEHGGQQV
jgi:hypothetical protein